MDFAALILICVLIGAIIHIILTPGWLVLPQYVNGQWQLNIVGTILATVITVLVGYTAIYSQVMALASQSVPGLVGLIIVAIVYGFGMPSIIQSTVPNKTENAGLKVDKPPNKE